MGKIDKTIVCNSCSTEFIWTVGEQEFYLTHEFAEPKRCRECRKARKADRNQNQDRQY